MLDPPKLEATLPPDEFCCGSYFTSARDESRLCNQAFIASGRSLPG